MKLSFDLKKTFSLWSNQSGAILIEAALSFMLLAPILIGLSDLGLATKEWMDVNDLAEAATLFVTTHANKPPTGVSYDIYSTNPFNTATITNALGVGNSGINSNVGTLTVTGSCSCPSAGAAICSGAPFASAPPKCSDTCAVIEGTIDKSAYICISVTHQHQSLFGAGFSPMLTAKSVVKIY